MEHAYIIDTFIMYSLTSPLRWDKHLDGVVLCTIN